MKIAIVDPSAYTPPYDHALCAALGSLGEEVELLTSRFPYGPTPPADGYRRREIFYQRAHAAAATGPRSLARLGLKLAEHVPGMLRCRRIAGAADVAHYQWLPVQPLDVRLLPGGARRTGRDAARGGPRLVLTAHDVMPREPRPGQLRAQRRLYRRFDAIVVHSEHGRQRLIVELGVPAERVHTIPHGAFAHLAAAATPPPGIDAAAARADAAAARSGPTDSTPGPGAANGAPVVLFFGLLRPYKGLDLLLAAWRQLAAEERRGAELWIAGMPRMSLDGLDLDQESVRVVPRFITDAEIPAFFGAAEIVVLPYREIDQSGVLFTALAFGKPLLLSDVGGFPEIAATGAAQIFPAGDVEALRGSLARMLADESLRARMASAARAAAGGPYAWETVATAHRALYRSLF